MSPACESVRRQLGLYGSEQLPESSRREVRGHLRECGACRAEAISRDNSQVFAGMAAPAVSSDEVAAFVAAVRAGVALKQTERRIAEGARLGGAKQPRRIWRVAAAAAVVALTLAIPSSLRDPASPAAPSGAAHSAPANVSAAASEGAVEASSGATVYDWSPGAGEPRVVWIVDGSLDI